MSGKRDLREEILANRRALSDDARAADDRQLASFAASLAGGHRRVAAYVPLPDEPGGTFLLPALAAVAEVLLPVHRPDNDLDWALSDTDLAAGATISRLREPTGPRLGLAAITSATLIVVPALAVDLDGYRLGRGGGSYDRALARLRHGVPVAALLYRGEVLPEVPREPHDQRVSLAVTPHGIGVVGLGQS